jgi:hypothetical protein
MRMLLLLHGSDRIVVIGHSGLDRIAVAGMKLCWCGLRREIF